MTVDLKELPARKNRVPIYKEETKLRQKRRRITDRWVRWIIAGGGFAIIASIMAILFFIGIEVLPLFRRAEVKQTGAYWVSDIIPSETGDPVVPIAVGLEENQEVGYLVSQYGVIQFFDVSTGAPREKYSLETIQGETITSVWQSLKGDRLAFSTDRGKVLVADIRFNRRFFEGQRSYRPEIMPERAIQVIPEDERITGLSFAGEPDGSMGIAVITGDGSVKVYLQEAKETLFGDVETASSSYELEKRWSGEPTRVAIDENLRNLYAGTSEGRIFHWYVRSGGKPEFVGSVLSNAGAPITVLDFLIGDRSLIVGDADGDVGSYSLVRDETAGHGWRLTRIHKMYPHPSAVTSVATSARGKGFISGDSSGNLLLQYTTSERLLAEFRSEDGSAVTFINYAPKANGALTLDEDGMLTRWEIDNPHPEGGFSAFFRKVWYEGYSEPEYVWQSSAATDDFEPKFSVIPLIFGSVKGTIYALILAIPLAILAALYTSQFMQSTFRNYVKPTIEIMAALPSVVLGFLAGLWLAPIIERVVPGVFLMFVVLGILILLSTLIWRQVPMRLRGRFRPGVEAALLIPVLVLGIWICLRLSGYVEDIFFEGNFTQWLFDNFEFRYDQRNALIVGFAMGFAVIPIIYTISEDAMSNVPQHLISGSLALGATRWQTAVRVVIPTAAAGIFSAVMIGFGRAVGETMIVLMATGNTPIMDWNLFNGFRTLSANIAVEIPEAPQGGTLYRLLFLTALLLFMITFVVNTLAEIIRQRVRNKYQKL